MEYNAEKSFEYNSSIAKKFNKPKVASFWLALEKLLEEFYNLSKEVKHKQVLDKFRVQMISPKSKDD